MAGASSLAAILERWREHRPVAVVGDTSVAVTGATLDSRRVERGGAFICVRGARLDGHAFAVGAVADGASVLVVDHLIDGIDATQIVVADCRRSAGPFGAAVHDHPSDRLSIVGVTGTNGKTTTTNLLAAVMNAAGTPTAVIGTLNGAHTTPEGPDLQRRLADLVAGGTRCLAMEVSSHALELHRVTGTRFTAAVFTNLSRDHLDLHGTEEAYFQAKARLFGDEYTSLGVVNLDDAHGRRLAVGEAGPNVSIVGFSLSEISDLQVGPDSHSYRWRGETVRVPIGARFNAENSLAAATTAAALGLDVATVARGLTAAAPVPGRFEPVATVDGYTVVVDYAHTPDGLRVALQAARHAAARRVIVVFGCGGDRDQPKRPQMGALAAELAEVVVVTSDNPRSEDPDQIVASIIEGVAAGYRDRVTVQVDRRAAIALALGCAQEGDVVLVAGKGHETTQTIGTSVLPFDDRAVVRELLEHPQ